MEEVYEEEEQFQEMKNKRAKRKRQGELGIVKEMDVAKSNRIR